MTFLRIQGCWKGDGWAGCHKGAVTWRPGSSEDLDNGNPKLLRIGNGWNFPQHFHHFHFPFIEKTGWLWSCRLVENTSSQDEFVRWYSSILGRDYWPPESLKNMAVWGKHLNHDEILHENMKHFQRFLGFLAGKYQEGLSPKVARYQVLQWFVCHKKVAFFWGGCYCAIFYRKPTTPPTSVERRHLSGDFCISFHQAGPTFQRWKGWLFQTRLQDIELPLTAKGVAFVEFGTPNWSKL